MSLLLGLSGAIQTLELPSSEEAARFAASGVNAAPLYALAVAGGLVFLASLSRARRGQAAFPVPRVLWGLLALLGLPAAMAVVGAVSLPTAAAGLAALTLLDLIPNVRGRRAPLAWLVGLGSVGVWWWASGLHTQAGGEGIVEWIGTPFSGDTPTTLAFLSLVVPLVLPGFLGGVWAGLSSGPVRNRAGRLGYGLTAFLRPLAYAALLSKTFGGTELLVPLGLALVWLAPFVGLFQRCADERLSTLAYAGLWALIGSQGVATERSIDAFGIGVIGWVLPVLCLALALAFIRSEEVAEPGLAPLGIARHFPMTYWTCLLAAAAAAGAPFLATFHGRVRSAGELVRYGNGQEALGYAVAAAPLFVLVAMPWVRYVFFSRPAAAVEVAPQRRLREPWLLLFVLLLSAAVTLTIGVAPDLVHGALPYGDMAPEAFPTHLGQLQLLLGAAIAASFFKRRIDRSGLKLSSTS